MPFHFCVQHQRIRIRHDGIYTQGFQYDLILSMYLYNDCSPHFSSICVDFIQCRMRTVNISFRTVETSLLRIPLTVLAVSGTQKLFCNHVLFYRYMYNISKMKILAMLYFQKLQIGLICEFSKTKLKLYCIQQLVIYNNVLVFHLYYLCYHVHILIK